MEKFLKLWEQFQTVIWPTILIVGFGVYKLYKSIKDKKSEVDIDLSKSAEGRRLEKLKVWEHEESMNVITNIRTLCNVYADKSNADRSLYAQMENGTVATSNISNMFITVLCEDNRFGNLPKAINVVQRKPYGQLGVWVEELRYGSLLAIDETSAKDKNEVSRAINTLYSVPSRSHLSLGVFNHEHVFVGICVFDYANPMYNGTSKASQVKLINEFKASVESQLLGYNERRLQKRLELGLKD